MRSRVLLGTLFGAIAGFLGFALQERLVSHDPVLQIPLGDMLRLGALVGAMIGIGIGAVEGTVVNSPRLLLRGTLLGGIVGALGGMFGIYFGGAVYNWALFGKDPGILTQSGDLLDFTHQVLARALGWTFLGAFPGLAAGAATLSRRRALHGLIGGLIGGFLGGFVFDLVASLISHPLQGMVGAASGERVVEIGGTSRAIGFTIIGTLTGLFVGLVEELMKQAWVRVLAGRNEGKDYIISKPLTVLGRDERADIPLFGDPALAPQHAAIRMENGRHVLLDGGTPIGAVVNGQRIQQKHLLKDGDMIQLGQVRLLFREKATATKVGRPVVDVPRSAQAPGALAVPSNLCPFCGAQKDANGNCLCTVPGAAAPGSPSASLPPPGYGGTGGLVSAPPSPETVGMTPAFGGGRGGSPDPLSVPSYAPTPSYESGIGVFGGMGTRLVALEGPYAGQSFPLSGPQVSIGRSPENMIALVNDSTVSRRHAHIAVENGRHVLYDDGSSNGTFVNGVRITVQTLTPGDIIHFGAGKFQYD